MCEKCRSISIQLVHTNEDGTRDVVQTNECVAGAYVGIRLTEEGPSGQVAIIAPHPALAEELLYRFTVMVQQQFGDQAVARAVLKAFDHVSVINIHRVPVGESDE